MKKSASHEQDDQVGSFLDALERTIVLLCSLREREDLTFTEKREIDLLVKKLQRMGRKLPRMVLLQRRVLPVFQLVGEVFDFWRKAFRGR